jgi:hypothetical protein
MKYLIFGLLLTASCSTGSNIQHGDSVSYLEKLYGSPDETKTSNVTEYTYYNPVLITICKYTIQNEKVINKQCQTNHDYYKRIQK